MLLCLILVPLPINAAAAATTKVVGFIANKVIYVCGFSATVVGTSATFKFIYGTKTTTECDTQPTALTGIFAPLTGSVFSSNVSFSTLISNGLCIVTTGSDASVQGVLSYVQM
jgi:hypothetical protein